MALSAEQQSQLEFTIAMDDARHSNQLAYLVVQGKQEATRLATQVLIENARTKPVDEREITAQDIATFANALIAATNA